MPVYTRLAEESSVEVKVKMIYDGQKGDIINQYVTFTRIYNEQIKLYGRTREAVLKAIRICKDQNVLSDYLSEREKEVVDIMMTLFDEEYILNTYIENERREAAQQAAEQAAEQAVAKTKAYAQRLYKKGNSIEDIAEILDVSEKEVEQWVDLMTV